MAIEETTLAVSEGVNLHTIISTPPQPSTSPALLLLHYCGGSNRTYHGLLRLLSGRYTVIAPSLRGWGQSSHAARYENADYVADVVGLVKELGASRPSLLAHGVVLVGHSMGGKLAQLLLTRDGVRPLVRGLVLLASAPAAAFSLSDAMRAQQIRAFGDPATARFVVDTVLLGSRDNVDDAEVDALTRDIAAGALAAKSTWPTEKGIGEDFEQAVVDTVKGWAKGNEGKALRVLVLVGDKDRVETKENVGAKVRDVLANAGAAVEMKVLQGVGHLAPVEAPQSLAEGIGRFVGDLS